MPSTFSVFICFRNIGRDLELAREVYDRLAARGFRVFFSPLVLEKQGTSEYKQAIERALEEARVLVAVATSRAALESEWVEREWSSFDNEILSGRKRGGAIFTYVEGFAIDELPYALRQRERIEHGRGSLERLVGFVTNALAADPAKKAAAPRPSRAAEGDDATERGWLALVTSAILTMAIVLAALTLLKEPEPAPESASFATPATPAPGPSPLETSGPAAIRTVAGPSPPSRPASPAVTATPPAPSVPPPPPPRAIVQSPPPPVAAPPPEPQPDFPAPASFVESSEPPLPPGPAVVSSPAPPPQDPRPQPDAGSGPGEQRPPPQRPGPGDGQVGPGGPGGPRPAPGGRPGGPGGRPGPGGGGRAGRGMRPGR